MKRLISSSAPAGAKDDSPGRKPGVCSRRDAEPRRGVRNAMPSFAPTGLGVAPLVTHGLRHGLSSFAATRLFVLAIVTLSIGCDDGSMTNNGRVKPHEA